MLHLDGFEFVDALLELGFGELLKLGPYFFFASALKGGGIWMLCFGIGIYELAGIFPQIDWIFPTATSKQYLKGYCLGF